MRIRISFCFFDILNIIFVINNNNNLLYICFAANVNNRKSYVTSRVNLASSHIIILYIIINYLYFHSQEILLKSNWPLLMHYTLSCARVDEGLYSFIFHKIL